ncbi:MAG: type II toxin-antitoxin system PemK/MazF family toxin [Geminicoccaceae bacterium]|nr:type II toxin-antitoxin system PemK/MazF family toxin [Geminicoccaceae bacterium]
MSLPVPHPGLVISYSYLWANKHRRGQEEGRKDRPCAIVVARQTAGGETVTTVVPVTHTPPHDPASALELPASIKKHLGLDDERSWIILDEVNDFFWPGPDLRPVEPGKIAYGVLPPGFFRKMRDLLLKIHAKRKLALVRRSE